MGPDIRGVPQNEVVEWGASLWYSTTDDILRIHLLGPMTVSTKEAELLDGNERRKRALVVAYYSNLFTTWLDRDHEFEFDASSYEFLFGKENGQYPGYGGVVGVRITVSPIPVLSQANSSISPFTEAMHAARLTAFFPVGLILDEERI